MTTNQRFIYYAGVPLIVPVGETNPRQAILFWLCVLASPTATMILGYPLDGLISGHSHSSYFIQSLQNESSHPFGIYSVISVHKTTQTCYRLSEGS